MQSPDHEWGTTPTELLVLRVGDGSGVVTEATAGLADGTTDLTVKSVESATAVLDRLQQGGISCVVTGTDFLNVGPLAFLDGVRAVSPDVPVVVVSDAADPELATRILTHDATDYVHWRGEAYQRRGVARRVENAVARYRAERTAGWTRAYYDALVHQAPDPILTIDEGNRIVFANEAVERVFGYEPSELVGEPLTTLVPKRLREPHLDAFDRFLRTGTRTLDWEYVELPGRHRDGHEVPLAMSFRELTDDGQRLFSAAVRDVTPRKRAEDERRLLHAAVRGVAAADTLRDGLEAAVTEVCDATEFAYGEAWVPAGDDRLERADTAYVVSDEYESFARVSASTSLGRGEGLPGRVWASAESIWMEDVTALSAAEFPRTEEAEAVGLKAGLGAPIVDEGRVVAVLAFYAPAAKPTDDGLVNVVTTVATELGELVARKQAEDELTREQEFTEAALNALPDIFFALDADGLLVRWNDEANAVTGYTDEELDGRHPATLVDDDDVARVADAIQRVCDHEEVRIEASLETEDGRTIPYELTGALLETDDDERFGIAGIGRDMTERKRRKRQLKASRKRYRKLVETAPDAVFVVDAESGRIVDTNVEAERLLGKSREELVGTHQSELHPDSETERYRRIFEAHVESGGAAREDDDYYVVHDDGHRIPVEISAAVTEIDGRTLNQAVFRDVSQRKRREETLATLRNVTRELMSAGSKRDICELAVSTARDILDLPISGIHLLDEDQQVLRPVAMTPGARELFDDIPTFEAGEGLAWQVFESGSSRLYDSVRSHEAAHNPDTPIRTEMILPLGGHGVLMSGSTESEELTEAELDLAEILAANAEAALDRADREGTIQRQRDRLQAELDEVFERIDDGFFALDDEWRFTYVNEQAKRFLEADETDLFGATVWDAFPEFRDSEVGAAFRRAVETQTPVSREDRIEASGAWFEFRAHPSESGLSVYVRDVTDRKRRENRLKEQNERLESFASMLAHELRNPLSIAQIYLETAEQGDESAFEQVADALDRIEEMIDVLLVMTRGGDSTVDAEPVALRDAATEAWARVPRESGCLDVRTDHRVRAEPSHLQQLLENLFRNAVEHGSTSNRPSADDAVEHANGEVAVRVGSLEEGFYVADDGPGIPPKERNRVFDAGYTTDEAGIGLGLTFVSQLAEMYGWDYRLTESEEGGARFEFTSVETEE